MRIALVLALLAALPCPARAGGHPPAPPPPAADSLALLEEARGAIRDRVLRQDSFESVLRRLDQVGEGIPGDDEVLRHRIATRLLLQRFDEAHELAEACAPGRWWCHAMALLGSTLVGDWERAHRAAELLERHQPAAEWCVWLDEAWHLLDDATMARRWTELDCQGRDQLVEELWWLSDPAHLELVNPRRLEHLARVIGMVLHHDELELLGNACPVSHHRPVLREGWNETGYWLMVHDPFLPRRSAPPRSYLPEPSVLEDPFRAAPEDWRWHRRPRPASPRARLEGVGPLGPLADHQVALLPRGDSMEVHSAYRISGGPGGPDPGEGGPGGWSSGDGEGGDPGAVTAASGRTGLVLSTGPGHREMAMAPWPREAGGTTRTSIRVPRTPHLASLEALPSGRGDGVDGEGGAFRGGGILRERFGLVPPADDDGLVMSDLLLFAWDEALPEVASAVVPHMQAGLALDPGGVPTGIHWEVHGPAPGTPLDMTLVIEEVEVGRLRRLGRALRLVGPAGRLELHWSDRMPEPGSEPMSDLAAPGIAPPPLGRSIRPDVGDLPPGRHRLEIRVETPDGRQVTARRIVQVVGSPERDPV